MENIETLDLVVFVEVARTGSFGAAAEQLLLATPSVSTRMNRLEKKLGITLFIRTPRGSRLTESGQRFLSYAQRCLTLLQEARHAVQMESRRHATIAIPASLGAPLFRPVLDVLNRVGVTADCRVAHSKEVVEYVLDGTAAAGFVINTLAPGSVRSHALLRSPMWAVAHRSSRLAAATELTVDDLYPFGVAIYRWGPEAASLAAAIDHPLRTGTNSVYLIGLPVTVLELVADGYVGIVPAFSLSRRADLRGNFVRLPLQFPEWNFDIDLVHPKVPQDQNSIEAIVDNLGPLREALTPQLNDSTTDEFRTN